MVSNFDWKTALKILAALVITGFVWTQDNQVAMLTLAAMAIVWGVKFYSAKSGKTLGKSWLTGILLAVSVAFSLLFQPVNLPPFPAYGGDAQVFVQALIVYAGALLVLGEQIFALATGLYNILLGKVLDGLSLYLRKPEAALVKSKRTAKKK